MLEKKVTGLEQAGSVATVPGGPADVVIELVLITGAELLTAVLVAEFVYETGYQHAGLQAIVTELS